jgi:hypothetical protein
LLLAYLAADGQPIKPASKTAHEYGEQLKENKEEIILRFEAFADIYSEIRWREFNDPADMNSRFYLLVEEYNKILSMRKRGLHHVIKRFFSLRGLAYL